MEKVRLRSRLPINPCQSMTPIPNYAHRFERLLQQLQHHVDLNEAETIVAAGRGSRRGGQGLSRRVSGVLNAGIGDFRALTEAGVYDPSVQIGQTGKVVSPHLYIAVGISGAIQHVAGIINSKVIVAVNKDADAPIFEVADYGIVGDLYESITGLIAEIKQRKG